MSVDAESSSPEYVTMDGLPPLTPYEVSRLRSLLASSASTPPQLPREDDPTGLAALSTDSDYPLFHESTHAWAVFADDPRKSATWQDRMVGSLIIVFQLYTYSVFATEAIEDYQQSWVPVMIRHESCVAASYAPDASNLECDAEFTNNNDAFVAFFMLGVFLSGDMIQAIRVLWDAPRGVPKVFAMMASLEVLSAFAAACLSVSYNLYKGEVTDAIAAGVGLLFIRELSSKTYAGIRNGKRRQYYEYFGCLVTMIVFGMAMDPLCERLLSPKYK